MKVSTQVNNIQLISLHLHLSLFSSFENSSFHVWLTSTLQFNTPNGNDKHYPHTTTSKWMVLAQSEFSMFAKLKQVDIQFSLQKFVLQNYISLYYHLNLQLHLQISQTFLIKNCVEKKFLHQTQQLLLKNQSIKLLLPSHSPQKCSQYLFTKESIIFNQTETSGLPDLLSK